MRRDNPQRRVPEEEPKPSFQLHGGCWHMIARLRPIFDYTSEISGGISRFSMICLYRHFHFQGITAEF